MNGRSLRNAVTSDADHDSGVSASVNRVSDSRRAWRPLALSTLNRPGFAGGLFPREDGVHEPRRDHRRAVSVNNSIVAWQRSWTVLQAIGGLGEGLRRRSEDAAERPLVRHGDRRGCSRHLRVVARLEFGRWHVANGFEQPPVVEPIVPPLTE